MNQPPDFDSNLSPSPQQNLGQSVAGSTVEGAIHANKIYNNFNATHLLAEQKAAYFENSLDL